MGLDAAGDVFLLPVERELSRAGQIDSTTAFQGSTGANALVIEPADGKIIAVGSSDTSGQESVALARYLP
ncbi:MAG: hypothetical protein JOY56_15740 [Solirubrobacterales bacterium]|nr:hypothetical protein [Solirubrobacterales bacterium]